MGVGNNIIEARNQALRYALTVAEERGIDGLRDEISRRGIMNLSILAPAREILSLKVDITERVIDIVTLFAIKLIIDDFGFDDYDAKMFYEKFTALTVDILIDPEKNLDVLKREVEEKTGLKMNIRKGLEKEKKKHE